MPFVRTCTVAAPFLKVISQSEFAGFCLSADNLHRPRNTSVFKIYKQRFEVKSHVASIERLLQRCGTANVIIAESENLPPSGCIASSASELSAYFGNLHVEKVSKEARCGLTQNAVIPITDKSKLHFLICKSSQGRTQKELKITAKCGSRNREIVADLCFKSKSCPPRLHFNRPTA